MFCILDNFRIDKRERRDGKRLPVKPLEGGKDAAVEAEVRAARERAIIPLEIRMQQFQEMLAEKEVEQSLSCF